MPNLRGASPVDRDDGGSFVRSTNDQRERVGVDVEEELVSGGAVVEPSRFTRRT